MFLRDHPRDGGKGGVCPLHEKTPFQTLKYLRLYLLIVTHAARTASETIRHPFSLLRSTHS